MSETPSERDYVHFQWTMPGGAPGGPVEPLVFSIVAAEMLLAEVPAFVEGLRGMIDGHNIGILHQAAKNLLTDPKHGPQQQHVECSDPLATNTGNFKVS